ncbi:MAG: NAD(P)-dependent oxidoreductase [Nitrospira sp. SB0666_bin_27]|nr:NAD(P)-dependent oxidoreductase [Nitrospira sp. SB0666_bin_27]MYF23711.1 NAD(P)-dependent oxidoreductase [Nitrospira sp. SB0678_bin_10]
MQVSLIGTGLMGTAMAERLLTLGHDVVVYNRTEEKCAALQQRGAFRARSAAEAIEASKCTILMLADAPAIREALFASGKPDFQNRMIIQMGTIAPSESITFGREIRTGIGDYFEAPVLGSIAEAKAGRLLVMVGGKAEHAERWHELLKCFCEEPLLVGAVGQAAALKLALNQLIAAHITAFSLSLGLAQRSGVEVETFMNVLRQSALMAPMFEKKFPRLLARDYARPNFSTRHLLKDVALCLNASRDANVATPVLAAIRGILEETVRQGRQDADYSSVFEAVVPGETSAPLSSR